MWLTGIVSYPLARLLDTIAGQNEGHGLFTNEEMAGIIKYHELTANKGGGIGSDTARVMLGALNLDSRKVGGDITLVPESNSDDEKDVEKADLIIHHGLVVRWPDVKSVNIDDIVDENFIKMVNSWSHNRIPVIGDQESHETEGDPATAIYRLEGKLIFGFLHVKDLVGVEIREKHKSPTREITVKDLTLYPLLIIHEDMPVYDLLRVFQLGVSGMAIVVPKPPKLSKPQNPSQLGLESSSKENSAFRAVRWATSGKKQLQVTSSITGPGSVENSVRSNIDAAHGHSQASTGILSLKPIGIVTFDDIIGALLQNLSRDRCDYFNSRNRSPRTESRIPADCITLLYGYAQRGFAVPVSPRKAASVRPSIPPTLRRRKVSAKTPRQGKACTMDRADELSNNNDNTQYPNVKASDEESSYAQLDRSSIDVLNTAVLADALIRPLPRTKADTLPSRRAIAAVLPDQSTPFWRRVSSAPRLPQLQRVTPFSRQNYSSYEKMDKSETKSSGLMPQIAPDSSLAGQLSPPEPLSKDKECKSIASEDLTNHTQKTATGSIHDDNQGEFSLMSWCPSGLIDIDEWNARLCHSIADTIVPLEGSRTALSSFEASHEEKNTNLKPWQGFPPELLSNTGKENSFLSHLPSTLPRMNYQTKEINLASENDNNQPRSRETFHDDRVLLPGQRRPIKDNLAVSIRGTRSSSFWI